MVALAAVGTLAAVTACSSGVTSQSVNPTRTVTATVTHQAAPTPTSGPTHTSIPPSSAHAVEPTATVTTVPPRATPTSRGGSSAATTTVVIYGCDGRPVGQPATFILFCGDAGAALQSLAWTGWGGPSATAAGWLRQNTCVPNCAAGGSVSYPATVTVSGLTGGRYTSMHVNAPSAPTPSSDFKLGLNGPVISR
ncbi:hypothetical protein DN069_12940 [Streptacidiphilus pinicola]|uniref:Uncharacterized protein n=1 Tax=Streptacidiphilus pinicola TaxID=2219663 RepID=A0A2X0KDC6_9ACTN|nr:hypothetical protein DN069_12940 [Streptacidiphilus pinicola]